MSEKMGNGMFLKMGDTGADAGKLETYENASNQETLDRIREAEKMTDLIEQRKKEYSFMGQKRDESDEDFKAREEKFRQLVIQEEEGKKPARFKQAA
jgi:hypothetical protein